MVAKVVQERHKGLGTLIDVGCGSGALWRTVGQGFNGYLGADVVRYNGFPSDGTFHEIDVEAGRVPLPDETGDVVAAVETIEHVENPRAFARELFRLCKPGGLVVITTPNQNSLLAKACFMVKGQFPAFQEAPGSYPSHLSALLEIDLVRIAREVGLQGIETRFSDDGRIPGSRRHWPRWFKGRLWSDNTLVAGLKPGC